MFSREYIDRLKSDQELTALRKEYHELTGKTATVELMNPLSATEWKEKLKMEIAQIKKK